MAEAIRIENRICPFCAFEYIRKVYQTDRNTGSICPNCRKRSDRGGRPISKWNAPKIKVCACSDCDETFYANGNQKYCLLCAYKVNLKNVRAAVKRFRLKQKISKGA